MSKQLATFILVLCPLFSSTAALSQDSGENQDPVADLLVAVEEDPTNRAAMVKLGNHFFDQEDWSQAEIWYERALKIRADDPNVLTDLAIVQRSLGEPELSLDTLSRALELNPNHWQALYNKAVVLIFDQERLAEGAEIIAKLEEMRSKFPDIPELDALQNAVEPEESNAEVQQYPSDLEAAAREFVRLQIPPNYLDELYQQATQASVVAVENSIQPAIGRAISDSERSRLTVFCNRMIREMMSYSELEDLLFPIVANHLTREELGEINTFLKSPIGQKLISVSASVSREGQVAGELLGQRLADSEWGQKFSGELKAQFPQWFSKPNSSQ